MYVCMSFCQSVCMYVCMYVCNQPEDLSQSKIEKYFKLYLLHIYYIGQILFLFSYKFVHAKCFNYHSYDNYGEAEIKKKNRTNGCELPKAFLPSDRCILNILMILIFN